jgi:hypothetical protein
VMPTPIIADLTVVVSERPGVAVAFVTIRRRTPSDTARGMGAGGAARALPGSDSVLCRQCRETTITREWRSLKQKADKKSGVFPGGKQSGSRYVSNNDRRFSTHHWTTGLIVMLTEGKCTFRRIYEGKMTSLPGEM